MSYIRSWQFRFVKGPKGHLGTFGKALERATEKRSAKGFGKGKITCLCFTDTAFRRSFPVKHTTPPGADPLFMVIFLLGFSGLLVLFMRFVFGACSFRPDLVHLFGTLFCLGIIEQLCINLSASAAYVWDLQRRWWLKILKYFKCLVFVIWFSIFHAFGILDGFYVCFAFAEVAEVFWAVF